MKFKHFVLFVFGAAFKLQSLSNVTSSATVAKILEQRGDVRVKPRGQFLWIKAETGQSLNLGDHVFVGTKANATLHYFSNRAILTMKELSLLEVEAEPSLRTRFSSDTPQQIKNQANKEKIEKENALNQETVKEFNQAATNSNSSDGEDGKTDTGRSLNKQQSKMLENIRNAGGSSPFRAILPLRSVKPLNLSENNELIVNKFPSRISLLFESSLRNYFCFVTLKEKKTMKAVWSDSSIGGFNSIPIEKPGEYILSYRFNEPSIFGFPIILKVKLGTKSDIIDRMSKLDFVNLVVTE